MRSTLAERAIPEQERREQREFMMQNDERSLRILHRISLRPGPFQTEARRAFLFMERQKPGKLVAMKDLELGLKPEALAVIEREVNAERLLYGEETPERKAFLEMRADVQETVREMKAQGDREYAAAMHELIPDREKRESVLYQEANEVLQNVAREMGIKRPIILEITRKPDLNAFIYQSEQEGGQLTDASAKPLHVYVNVGMFTAMQKAFEASGKSFTKDHLAGILGHELQHLRQPKYNMDEPPKDKELSQRFEYDADLVALETADKAGYNPMAFIEMMQAIQNTVGNLKGLFSHYFGGTHPLSENRVKDLLAEYHRPERVFFSADVEMQPFSDSIQVEAEAWGRDKLRKRLELAQGWGDWEMIIDDIDTDPRATFYDAEMALSMFKIQLEVRAVLSEAARELKTGELGLRDALLYAANANVSGKPIHLKIWESLVEESPHTGGGYGATGENPPFHGRAALKFLTEYSPDPSEHADPGLSGCVRLDMVKLLVDDIYTDTFLIPEALPDGPFRSMEDLYDASNEDAVRFWNSLESGSWNKTLPVDRREAVLLLMSRAFWFQRQISVGYAGEDVGLKKAVLENLKEAEPATSGMTPGQWGAAFGALSQRISTIRSEVAKMVVESETRKKEEETLRRDVNIWPFAGLRNPGDEKAGDDATQATRDRLRVQNRLFGIARRLFDRDLEGVPDVPEVKDWLFRRVTTDYLFSRDKETVFPVTSDDGFKRFGVVKDYFRVLPTSLRRTVGYGFPSDTQHYLGKHATDVDSLTSSIIGDIIRAEQTQMQASFRPEDIGDRLRDIRSIANNPLLTWANRRGRPNVPVTVENPEVARLLAAHGDMESQKKQLFLKWIRMAKTELPSSLEATRFYASAFADNLQELQQLKPTEINPFEESK